MQLYFEYLIELLNRTFRHDGCFGILPWLCHTKNGVYPNFFVADENHARVHVLV